jgi:hypothetical protein
VFYAEIPVPPRNWRTSWLITSLLDQWGDPAWDSQISSYDKHYRLEGAMRSAHVELIMVADTHRLVLPNDRVLGEQLDWLLSLSQSSRIPLVIAGEPEKMEQLILTDARFCSRFWPIRLPGMPKKPENPQVRARVRKLLGFPNEVNEDDGDG